MRIDDQLLADAKAFAARHGRSLNSVMEDALRQMLSTAKTAGDRPKAELPVYGDPNSRPLIDMSPEGLKEFLMEEDLERFREVQRDEIARRERTDQRPPA